MATTKPRITITLTQRQHDLLRAISGSSGQSMSSFVVEFLETAEPVLERMAATFQRIKQHQDKQREQIKANLEEAQTALEPLAASVLSQLDMFLGNLEGAATGARGRSSARTTQALPSPPSTSPRAVTTGATPPQPPTPSKPNKARKPASSKAKTKGGA